MHFVLDIMVGLIFTIGLFAMLATWDSYLWVSCLTLNLTFFYVWMECNIRIFWVRLMPIWRNRPNCWTRRTNKRESYVRKAQALWSHCIVSFFVCLFSPNLAIGYVRLDLRTGKQPIAMCTCTSDISLDADGHTGETHRQTLEAVCGCPGMLLLLLWLVVVIPRR